MPEPVALSASAAKGDDYVCLTGPIPLPAWIRLSAGTWHFETVPAYARTVDAPYVVRLGLSEDERERLTKMHCVGAAVLVMEPVANNGMQCKDIPDDTVISATEATPGYWRNWGEVWPRFAELMPGVPYNVFVAKVRRLGQRGLLHACVHDGKKQCRGDIHLPGECRGC